MFTLFGKKEIYAKLFSNFEVVDKKIIKDFNWTPPFNYKIGIKNTCLWYKNRFKIGKRK